MTLNLDLDDLTHVLKKYYSDKIDRMYEEIKVNYNYEPVYDKSYDEIGKTFSGVVITTNKGDSLYD